VDESVRLAVVPGRSRARQGRQRNKATQSTGASATTATSWTAHLQPHTGPQTRLLTHVARRSVASGHCGVAVRVRGLQDLWRAAGRLRWGLEREADVLAGDTIRDVDAAWVERALPVRWGSEDAVAAQNKEVPSVVAG
jgi:hypothetical protein